MQGAMKSLVKIYANACVCIYFKRAADLGRVEMVKFLFDEFFIDAFDVDQEWIDNIFLNSEKYSTEVVQLFIENGANIEKYGKKLYIKAKKNNNYHNNNYHLAEYLKKNYLSSNK